MFYNQWYVAGDNSGGGFSARHLFTESQNSLDMGNVQWWTSNVWNHFGWTGWTKPIWTPDPCYDQPLYSPNCSNFNDEIKRLADEQNKIQKDSLDKTVANISTTSPTPGGTVTNTVTDANTTSPTVSTTTTFTSSDTTTTATTSPKSTSTTTTTDTVAQRDSGSQTNQTATRTEGVRENNTTSFALSLINRNQERETNIAMQASQNAIREGEQRGMQSMRQAERMVMDQQQRQNQLSNMVPEQTNTNTEFKVQNQNNSLAMLAPPPVTSVVQIQGLPNFNSVVSSQQNNNQASHQIDVITNIPSSLSVAAPTFQAQIASAPVTIATVNNQTQLSVVSVTPVNIQQPIQQSIVTTPFNIQQQPIQQVAIARDDTVTKYEIKDTTATQTNFVTDKTNPITDLIDNTKPVMSSSQTQTNTQQVKSNVQDNDAAAGVSIANIARTPVGFNSYMVALTDAAFYAPKEIYRNQKTVDNARALRQLASDRLHQQMVDQQYLPR